MTLGKMVLSMAVGAASLFAVSEAGDITPVPADYQVQASTYVESRLIDARGARIQIVSEPYRIAAEVAGKTGVEGWGVDIRVKSRLPTGQYGGYVGYTVIFANGQPVALCEDTDELARV